jgi:DUF1680 family protein
MKKTRDLTRRQFVSTATAAVGAAFLPGAIGAGETDAAPPATGSLEQITWKARPFPLRQVRLGDGPCRQAMEADRKYLHFLPADRMLHTFRVTAGLPSSAEPIGGWEKPDCELRGHFAGGHILTAFALMHAASGDETLKAKGDYMVAELAKVQKALGGGYLGAYPTEFYDRLRDGRKVWAPFYTLHKILAGHLDMYLHCGNGQALEVAEKLAHWVGEWTRGLSAEHMQRVLEVEHGGMLEVLADLYAVTGKQEYLDTANRFDHRRIFNPLAARRDELKGLHANTNIPKITGVARRYELTGARRDHDIATYFWHEITSQRMYANGGTSCDEHWRTDPGKLAAELTKTTCECCCAYNMMKLTRHLFAWTADPKYFDYYERALFNHRLGTIHPEDGAMMYFVPLASGYWKFYNSPLNTFWCCTGTGVEEYAKLADSIYFHAAGSLFVNLFIASEVNWPEKGIRLRQATKFPEEEGTALAVEAEKPVFLALNIRVPYWATQGVAVKVNGKPQKVVARPASYITLRRRWANGDKVEVSLPMALHVHAMPDDATIQAMMYGPLVLVGRMGMQGLTREMMYGGYDTTLVGDPVPAPEIVGDKKNPVAWVERVAGEPLSFRAIGQSQPISLVPFYKLWGERYATYWKVRV